MKIGVNLLELTPGKIGGMEQYIRNLIWYSTKKTDAYSFYLFLNPNNFDSFDEADNRIKKIVITHTEDRNLQLYRYIEDLELDIWFCPLLVLEPQFVNVPTVVTIPDIQHEFFPEFFSKEIIEWRKENYQFSAQKADSVLTLSNFSKQSIVEKYSVREKKVHSIHLDSDKVFYEKPLKDKNEKVKVKYNLPENYIFYPANTWPHKNHLRLLEAMKILKNIGKLNTKLILTGSADQVHSAVMDFINKNQLSEDIFFLGYIDQEDMPYIYLNATSLVFPSLFEGFGIPLVEAMRSSCPIICSNAGSIPEIVEDCALLFDPYNPQDMAEKIERIVSDKELGTSLIDKGKARVSQFSWEKNAQQTLEIFSRITVNNRDICQYPLVSIITPSFNQGQFIRETIESVLNQDYPNLEYIVMDGGSTDETVEILKSYDQRIKWVSEKDEGQADAVNKGITIAKGEIIGWLNSDDTYLPGAVKKAVETLLYHNELGMVYGEGYHVKMDGSIIDRYPTESFNYRRLAEICYICQPTAFFKKRVLQDVGMLDKSLHLCMDYELWMRIGKSYTVGYIPHYIATSRMYEDNKTLSRRREVYEEIIKTVKKYYGYAPISWIYGYGDYLMNGKRGIIFALRVVLLFLKYNYSNIPYTVSMSKDLIKAKLKQRYRPQAFTGRYEDGWVSRTYIFEEQIGAPDTVKGLIIEGRHLWPYEENLKIKITINGEYVSTQEISEKGQYEIRVEDLKVKDTKNLLVQMASNKTFCPKRLGINGDVRELSYIIDNIRVLN